jgi:hypothetical protein
VSSGHRTGVAISLLHFPYLQSLGPPLIGIRSRDKRNKLLANFVFFGTKLLLLDAAVTPSGQPRGRHKVVESPACLSTRRVKVGKDF